MTLTMTMMVMVMVVMVMVMVLVVMVMGMSTLMSLLCVGERVFRRRSSQIRLLWPGKPPDETF